MIGHTISHYKILEKLGGGGMGVVYKAEDTKLKRLVALKFLPPDLTRDEEAKERFIHEAQAASALDHPNICTIHEIGETEDGQLFIVMAYYEGETLKKKVDSGQAMPAGLSVDSAIDYTIQIAQGLAKAHGHGITHRDIKPANVMITNDGVAKIVDFGLAKLTGQTKLTKAGATLGTVAYMSPEQARGEEVDHRADIWALGVVLYEMLTGQAPFKGDYELAVIYSILNENPQPISNWRNDTPTSLEEIVNKCLQKDINKRYQTAAELAIPLRDEQRRRAGSMPLTPSLPSLTTMVQMFRQHRWMTGLAATVVIAIAIALSYLTLNRTRSSEIPLQAMSSIAVMYFEDATGDEQTKWLARGLPHMLITSLEQCPELQVIGYQRLYDLLQELGKENSERIDKTTATEIARKAKAKTMLLGSIFKWGNVIRVDYQLQDVLKGHLLAAAKITGENPLSLADDLALQVRQNLGTSVASANAPKVSEVTTSSLEAYRYYLEGKDFESKSMWEKAWEGYAQAIRLDSTFAMAYRNMWSLTQGAVTRTQAMSDSMLAKALRYSGRTSERERLMILAEEANYHGRIRDFRRFSEELLQKYPAFTEFYEPVGDFHLRRREFDRSLAYYKKWVILSNYSERALENLIYVFEKLGQVDSARYYFNKYKELYANEATTHLLESHHYLQEGEIEKALRKARVGITINPEAPWSHRCLGLAYFFTCQFDSAETAFQQVGLKGWSAYATDLIAVTRVYQGKYASALRLLDEKSRVEDQELRHQTNDLKLTLYDFEGKHDQARELWLNVKTGLYQQWLSSRGQKSDTFIADSLLTLAIPDAYFNGDIDAALIRCDHLTHEISQNDLGGGYALRCLIWRAVLFYASGKFDEAAGEYEKVLKQERKTIHRNRLADCYYQLKKYEHAKALLAQIKKTDEPEIWWLGISFAYAYPRTFYLLGLVNEALGDAAGAMKAYQQFLEIWKEADKDLPELVDAKARLARLK